MGDLAAALGKLKILTDSAKYDVSCSSSGAARSNGGKRGSAAAEGICHSWSADGRCISLLKILFTNECVYDCEYCINRRSAHTARASFTPEELAELTMEFYRRNYIEGLFLSSAVEVSPDYTAERIWQALDLLRNQYGFYGYIHAKIIPGVSPELVHRIGLLADRLSVNVELPTRESLKLLAPQKKAESIFAPMKQITGTMMEQKTLKGAGNRFSKLRYNQTGKPLESSGFESGSLSYLSPRPEVLLDGQNATGEGGLLDRAGLPLAVRESDQRRGIYREHFAPAGQTTQMIIGATPETDRQIILTSEKIYKTFYMKRVYFSAYIPVVQSPLLPTLFSAPPLVREHRLYQADWLMRFYGFSANEILDEAHPNFDLEVDPKVDWALRNIELFPIEINKASMEEILRIPGVGNVSAARIVRQRRVVAVRWDDLKKLGVVVKRAKYFLTCSGKYYGDVHLSTEQLRARLSASEIRNRLLPIDDEVQLSMFPKSHIESYAGSLQDRILDRRGGSFSMIKQEKNTKPKTVSSDQIRSVQTDLPDQIRQPKAASSDQVRSVQADLLDRVRSVQADLPDQIRQLQAASSDQVRSAEEAPKAGREAFAHGLSV